MRAHLKYLAYVLRHKWHVAIGCWLLGVSPWQALVHDLSKFSPAEWGAYVRKFYGRQPTERDERVTLSMGIYIKTRAEIESDFDAAWNHHQKVNPHHWQYWLLVTDSDDPRLRPLPIPQRYILEMVADWYGAGMAISGKNDVEGWYLKNKAKILMDEGSRERLEAAIQELMLRVVRVVD